MGTIISTIIDKTGLIEGTILIGIFIFLGIKAGKLITRNLLDKIKRG